MLSILFFFNDTATTEIYTLSLHDALPIYGMAVDQQAAAEFVAGLGDERGERRVVGLPKAADAVLRFPEGELAPVHRLARRHQDRKSTRLNSSHANISYAVFCLKKNNKHSQ